MEKRVCRTNALLATTTLSASRMRKTILFMRIKEMKVSVKANKIEASSNNVRGLCTLTFGDSFAVRNVSIVESRKGGTFVSMPSFKNKTVDEEGNPIFKDIVFPITKEFREELYKRIKESYESGEMVEFEWE